jgi:hypothetical protein
VAVRPNAVEKAAITMLASEQSYRDRPLRAAVEERFPGAVARAKAALRKAKFDRKFIGQDIPRWAKTYIAKHCPAITSVTVRHSDADWREHTSGHYKTWDHTITITVGQSEDDARLALLHEIAHARRPHAQHGDDFYDEYRRLLVAEGMWAKAVNSPVKHGGQARGLKAAARRARTAAPAAKPIAKPADGEPGPQFLRDLMRL